MRISTTMAILLFAGIMAGVAFAGTSGPSPVPSPPTFVASTTMATLCKGMTNYIPVSLTNIGNTRPSIGISSLNGTPMQYVQLSLGSSKQVVPVGNGTAYVGSVNPGKTETAYLPVFVNANASLITTLAVNVNYYYLVYYSDSETRNLTFEVQTCSSPIALNVSPKTLASGQIQNISINLTNRGDTTLISFYVHYTVPSIDGAIIGNTYTQLGSLAPGQTAHINATVFVSRNASIESFPFNVSTTFYNGNDLEQVVNSTSLIPAGTIALQTSGLTLSPSSTSPGNIFSVSFVLTNIGTSGASAVTVYALPSNSFSAFGTNPVYVGDIGSDAQSPVTVTLTTGRTTRIGNYSIPLKINYLNGLRQNISEMVSVPVQVFASANGTFPGSGTSGAKIRTSKGGPGILILIMAIIIIVLAVLLVRERGKGKRNQK